MKAYQVFARMTPERAEAVLNQILEKMPAVYRQTVAAASAVFKARPRFLMQQSPARRASLVRQALARVAANELAEEVLAAYFLEVRRPLLVEWLDTLGVEHEEGALQTDHLACPPQEKLDAALAAFRKPEDEADRELLLEAFAAQSAVDWPALDAALDAHR
jgi:hypothetical protein